MIHPGYSITYDGVRLDNPLDDDNNPVNPRFTHRTEYEAPVEICEGIPVIPMRQYKDNI